MACAALRTKERQATEKKRNAVPAGGLRPTKNNRSSRSSDDLIEEEMWPTRTIAVALVGMRRSEDEGRANHRNYPSKKTLTEMRKCMGIVGQSGATF